MAVRDFARGSRREFRYHRPRTRSKPVIWRGLESGGGVEDWIYEREERGGVADYRRWGSRAIFGKLSASTWIILFRRKRYDKGSRVRQILEYRRVGSSALTLFSAKITW